MDKYIENKNVKKYVLENKDEIVSTFIEERCHNIRTVIFALIAFEKFWWVLEGIKTSLVDYLNEEKNRVLIYTIKDSIKIKTGEKLYLWRNSDAKSGMVFCDSEAIKKSAVYGYRFVDDYLLWCKLDKDYIKDTILENINERNRIEEEKKVLGSLLYRKLERWWELEDEEIESILLDFPKELSAGKYTPFEFKRIIVTLMQLQDNGFTEFQYGDFVQAMEKVLSDYSENLKKRTLEVFSDDKEFIKNYNKIAKPLFDIIEERENKEKQRDNSRLIDKEQWNESFEEFCWGLRDEYMKDKKFFSYIECNSFMVQLKCANVKQIIFFTYGVKAVYNFSNLNDYFISDIPNLNAIIQELDTTKLCNGKRTRKLALEMLLKELKDDLELIARDSSL